MSKKSMKMMKMMDGKGKGAMMASPYVIESVTLIEEIAIPSGTCPRTNKRAPIMY